MIGAGLAVLAGAMLGGCGFRPVYGTWGGVMADQRLAVIDVDVIAEREGQILRGYLVQRLNPGGRPADPVYRLSVTLAEVQADLAVQDGRTGTRRNLTTTATYRLYEIATGATMTNGQIRTITSYNRQIDEFATLAAERDARTRSLISTAEDIRIRLAAHFAAPDTDATAP